jgi:dihydropteroate synthase
MIQKVIEEPADKALNGTTAAHVIALQNGANILRVHDVKAAKEACQIVDFYQKQ